MGYICTKRLSLGGETYYPGDSIPDNAFVSGRVNKLKASGYVTEADDAEPAAVEANVTVGVVALDLDGTGNLCTITNEALQTAVFTMQKSASDAAAAILTETDETVLTFISSVDSRKTVTRAAQEQLATLTAYNDGSGEAPQEDGATDEQ